MTRHIWQLEAHELAALIRNGRLSAREATQAHLDRMDAVNPALNAVVHTYPAQALVDADAADAMQRRGEPLGPLHGVPVTIKITADQKGQPSDNGVKAFKGNIALEDSPVVRNLKSAGAITIGRTNSPAFAMRFCTQNALHGRTFNPHDPRLTAGGSSGGAAAAVAAGIGAIAHGTDIGGSIRWPAYCNGIYGLRTTPGRIPSRNASQQRNTPMSVQLMAVAGPLARSVKDLRLGYAAMAAAGHPGDPLWAPFGEPRDTTRPRKVALMTNLYGNPIDSACRAAVLEAGHHLASAGYVVEEVEPPDWRLAFDLWNTIAGSEWRVLLEPQLSLVDDPDFESALRQWWDISPMPDLTKYLAAMGERHALMRRWSVFMQDYPLVITPVGAVPQMEAGADAKPGGMRFVLDNFGRFLFPAPLLGLPVVAAPLRIGKGQMLGVQIHGPRFREDLCLEAAEVIEGGVGPLTVAEPSV